MEKPAPGFGQTHMVVGYSQTSSPSVSYAARVAQMATHVPHVKILHCRRVLHASVCTQMEISNES
jgi:hypothetical protein